jgi:hypothetical protein
MSTLGEPPEPGRQGGIQGRVDPFQRLENRIEKALSPSRKPNTSANIEPQAPSTPAEEQGMSRELTVGNHIDPITAARIDTTPQYSYDTVREVLGRAKIALAQDQENKPLTDQLDSIAAKIRANPNSLTSEERALAQKYVAEEFQIAITAATAAERLNRQRQADLQKMVQAPPADPSPDGIRYRIADLATQSAKAGEAAAHLQETARRAQAAKHAAYTLTTPRPQ